MYRWNSDHALAAVAGLAARLGGLIVLLVVGFVLVQSWPALEGIGPVRFVTDASWHPGAAPESGRFGLLPMMIATLASSIGALLLAGPLGILFAVFLTDHAPARSVGHLRALIELMAGIPSVVYGLWGLVTLVPMIAAWRPPGASLLSGIVVLSLMILPTVCLGAIAALRAVPAELRIAALGLGFTRAGTLWKVVIPSARAGLQGALILALARALGETMAVLMVSGNVVQVPDSVFSPVRTLTANIALELGYATALHRSALFVGGLFLALLVGMLVLLAERAQGAPHRE